MGLVFRLPDIIRERTIRLKRGVSSVLVNEGGVSGYQLSTHLDLFHNVEGLHGRLDHGPFVLDLQMSGGCV
jgi:hypothetical protein